MVTVSAGTAIEGIPGRHRRVCRPGRGRGGGSQQRVRRFAALLRETDFLFAGDAETASGKPYAGLRHTTDAEVLKTGHHGSDTSTSRHFWPRSLRTLP